MNLEEARELREELKSLEQLPRDDEPPPAGRPRPSPAPRDETMKRFRDYFLFLLPYTVLATVGFELWMEFNALFDWDRFLPNWENLNSPQVRAALMKTFLKAVLAG